MKKDLALPSELPEGFTFTETTGLTREEAEKKAAAGLGNRMTVSDEKTIPQIISSHVFTLFNLINFALGVCLLLVGSYRNMLFIFVDRKSTRLNL